MGRLFEIITGHEGDGKEVEPPGITMLFNIDYNWGQFEVKVCMQI